MPNLWTKTTQKLQEIFNGPRSKDTEFENKAGEFKVFYSSLLSLKSLIINSYGYFSSYKTFSSEFSHSLNSLYNSESLYKEEINKACEAHVEFSNHLDTFKGNTAKLFPTLIEMIKGEDVINERIKIREERREDYDHYDKKLVDLYQKYKTTKNAMNDSDLNEKISRNEGKYREATNKYVDASIDAFKSMDNFIDSRERELGPLLNSFLFEEKLLFANIYKSFKKFDSFEKNVKELTGKHRPYSKKFTYDPEKYLRDGCKEGKDIVNKEKEERNRGKSEGKKNEKTMIGNEGSNQQNQGMKNNLGVQINNQNQIPINKRKSENMNSNQNSEPFDFMNFNNKYAYQNQGNQINQGQNQPAYTMNNNKNMSNFNVNINEMGGKANTNIVPNQTMMVNNISNVNDQIGQSQYKTPPNIPNQSTMNNNQMNMNNNMNNMNYNNNNMRMMGGPMNNNPNIPIYTNYNPSVAYSVPSESMVFNQNQTLNQGQFGQFSQFGQPNQGNMQINPSSNMNSNDKQIQNIKSNIDGEQVKNVNLNNTGNPNPSNFNNPYDQKGQNPNSSVAPAKDVKYYNMSYSNYPQPPNKGTQIYSNNTVYVGSNNTNNQNPNSNNNQGNQSNQGK
eukprot:CAMPEP_0170519352 /NCGR_PEP_ID=MMETSP0209-20121228/4799_1 /TAXON_ID=665100 ORGANISM="Litonotus pictus, Strain P1" /NCGR_SAMPLE_ID=MMETSP0209 /ASSEMBLY_ACC=CAM_ASM_000301 /LENGTH=616 /DNA_ID=CAMNT_0010805213 /DNA_START=1 /DNA_END=1851 /DNA_ORIENTATION=+